MSAKARVITTIVLLLTVVIILGACAPKVQLPVLREAPDFTLTNQDGLEVKLSHFQGKVVVMDFIYTNCPDVCGMLNHKLRIVRDQLEEGLKQDLVLISVSFDTEVDTPQVLKQYATEQGFDVPGWYFLTGPQEQIRQVTDDYGVAYELVEADDELDDEVKADHEYEGLQEYIRDFKPNIMVALIDRGGMLREEYHEHAEDSQGHVRGFNHNIVVVLIDRDGMVRKTYGYALFPESEMVSDITSLLER